MKNFQVTSPTISTSTTTKNTRPTPTTLVTNKTTPPRTKVEGKQERFGQGGSQKRTPNKKEGETKDSKHEGLQEKVLSASKKTTRKPKRLGKPPSNTVTISGQIKLKSFLELKERGRVSTFQNSSINEGLVNQTTGLELAPSLLNETRGAKTTEAEYVMGQDSNSAAGVYSKMKGKL